MRTLVIDSATAALSLALFDGDARIAHHHAEIGRGHAEAIVPEVQRLLNGARPDHIAVDTGPGSFTGIRVGLAAARALAMAWNIPVSGFACLPLCAAIARENTADTQDNITITMLGGHGELFWQRFARDQLTPMTDMQSTPLAELAAALPDHALFGSGAAALVQMRGWGEAHALLPDARGYWSIPAPFRDLPVTAAYGRGADARPMAERAGHN